MRRLTVEGNAIESEGEREYARQIRLLITFEEAEAIVRECLGRGPSVESCHYDDYDEDDYDCDEEDDY